MWAKREPNSWTPGSGYICSDHFTADSYKEFGTKIARFSSNTNKNTMTLLLFWLLLHNSVYFSKPPTHEVDINEPAMVFTYYMTLQCVVFLLCNTGLQRLKKKM